MLTETVGERLRRLRVERGVSQRTLAEPGVSYAYLSRIERGERAPSVKALRLIAPKLGVTAAYLETGSHMPDLAALIVERRLLRRRLRALQRERTELLAKLAPIQALDGVLLEACRRVAAEQAAKP
jgi:transcriptional regulator with XRE-family HTH domain